MSRRPAVHAALLFALACASCACLAPRNGGEAVRFTVLHTNDHHGRYWRRPDGSAGLAARKTVVDEVRREVAAAGGHVLLLDGGDVNTGVPESDLQQAEPDFVGMSALGYDAMAVGNHEFDPPEAVQRQQREAWSRFPWLSANVYRGGERLFEPYRIFRLGRLRVAVMGLTTEDTARMLSARKHPQVRFTPPVDEASRLVPELRLQADVVVAATHMGHYTDGRHGVSAPGDVELARAVAGIDLVVGGHTHTPLCMLAENLRNDRYEPGGPCAPDRQNGAWIVQAGELGKFVGRADFEWRPGQGLTLLKYTLIPVNLGPAGPAIAEDPAVLGLLAPYQQRAAAGLQAPVGRADARFDGDRGSVRHRPTALGTLLTRAMAEKAQAHFAVVSGGGIRDSLPAGELRLRDLLQALPFGNQLAVVEMSGAEVSDYVAAMAAMTPGSGAFPQSWGLRYAGDGGVLRQVWVQGEPLDRAARYRMAVSSFVAGGGDGYPDLSRHPGFTNTGWVDVDVLREFIGRHSPLSVREFEADAR